MAPVAGMKAEKEKRLSYLLNFTSQLLKRLDAKTIDETTSEDVDTHIKMHFSVPPSAMAPEFDVAGTKLWNAALRLREQHPNLASPRLLSQLRVLAFLLIDLAQQAMAKQLENPRENLVRILRTAHKVARTCIASDELDLCAKVFERIAAQLERRDPERGYKYTPNGDEQLEQEATVQGLVAEYHILRATLAWKHDRLDLATHWLSKVSVPGDREVQMRLVHQKADLMYEIGNSCLKRKLYEDAVKWLEGACDTVDAADRETVDEDCIELRTSIVSAWVRSLLGLRDPASVAKASKLVALLENDSGFKMAICLLRLSVLAMETPAQAEEMFSVLLRMIRSSVITDGAFKTIMNQIQKLKEFDVGFASQALDSILPRLYEMHPTAQLMLEKVAITKLWITTSRPHNYEYLPGLRKTFDEIHETTALSFGPEVTHAAQSLMWKNTSSSNNAQSERAAEAWCRLACHPLLQRAGDLNKSKLARKMILLAFSRGDAPGAREAYFQMPENGKNAAITKYLMYKVALRSGDVKLASDSLEGVLKASTKDSSFLYACALEAHQRGDRQQAITVLQKVLEHYGYSAPAGVYLPSLLRCTATSIMTEMKDKRIPAETALPELCKIFEGAMAQANKFRAAIPKTSTNDQYPAELRWFASQSYNLSLQHCADMQPELLVRFVTVSIAFVGLLRQEDNADRSLVIRSLLCHFLAASGLIVIGRSEDNVEKALQTYADIRRQAEKFYTLHREVRDTGNDAVDDGTRTSVAAKQFEMLKYDLEAVLKLQHWNDLDRILEMCLEQQHTERWGTVADLVIHIQTHILKAELDARYLAKIPTVIEKIINISWRNNRQDVAKLARWLRCLFQITLAIDPAMSLKCLDQACAIAKSPKMQGQFPMDELEWLATTSFNHAVDLHCASDDTGSRQWAEKAIALAMAAGPKSGLHGVLQEKWLQMRLRVNDG